MFEGRYSITRLKAKPSWIPKRLWLALFHKGLLNWAVISQTNHKNLIVFNDDHGVHLILQRLGGIKTYDLELDNASIGTGSTAPTDDDTDLETPVVENIERSTSTVTSDAVMTEWFLTDTDLPNGTYNEFGLKCGTQLFCRSIISPAHTKGSLEDTLIQYTISAANALP